MIEVVALVLAALLAITMYVCVVLVRELNWTREDLQAATDTEHAKCMAAVMQFVGDEWAAQVLEVAAADYDSPGAQRDLDRIGRMVYKPGGAPVPTLWLQERADRLRIMADKDWDVDLEVAHVD